MNIFEIQEICKATPRGDDFISFVQSFKCNLMECQELPNEWEHLGNVYSKETMDVYGDNKDELQIIARALKGKDMIISIQSNEKKDEIYPVLEITTLLRKLGVKVQPVTEFPPYKNLNAIAVK